MLILPPFPSIALSYRTSRPGDRNLNPITPVTFLGARDDNDRESQRLHRAFGRRLQAGGVLAALNDNRLKAEIQRYGSRKLGWSDPSEEILDRIENVRGQGPVSVLVECLRCGPSSSSFQCESCERMAYAAATIDGLALKCRHGRATWSDFMCFPWLALGALAVPEVDDSSSTRAERFLALDILAFLWVAAHIVSHFGLGSEVLKGDIPPQSDQLGARWFTVLEDFALFYTRSPDAPPKPGRKPRYRAVAEFILAGDETGGAVESLSERLSKIDRGELALTSRLIDQHASMVSSALEVHFADQPRQRDAAQEVGNLIALHGHALGMLQHVRNAVLPGLQDDHPDADLIGSLDAALACWPTLLDLVLA